MPIIPVKSQGADATGGVASDLGPDHRCGLHRRAASRASAVRELAAVFGTDSSPRPKEVKLNRQAPERKGLLPGRSVEASRLVPQRAVPALRRPVPAQRKAGATSDAKSSMDWRTSAGSIDPTWNTQLS